MKKILMVLFLLGTTLFAEVKTQLTSTKVISKEGKIEKVSADTAQPGDILNYNFHITNEDINSVKNLNPTIPVPLGTTLIPESISPKNFKVSTNGKDFLKFPILENGTPVPNSAYRAVLWNIESLDRNKELTVQLNVQINNTDKNQ